MLKNHLKSKDAEVYAALVKEDERQQNNLEMIASENFVSQAVLETYSSTLTNKYAEGYPGKRYYNGCENADIIEDIAIDRAKKLFNANTSAVLEYSHTIGDSEKRTATIEGACPSTTSETLDLYLWGP